MTTIENSMVGNLPPAAAVNSISNVNLETALRSVVGQVAQAAVSGLAGEMASRGIPQAISDEFTQKAHSNLEDSGFGGAPSSFMTDAILEMVTQIGNDMAKDAANEATREAGGAGGAAKGGMNWQPGHSTRISS